MYEDTKCAPETALADLGAALADCWTRKKGKRKGGKAGFPQFKQKGRFKDIFYVSNDQFVVEEPDVRIARIRQDGYTRPQLGWLGACSFIASEDLNVAGMLRNARLARAISDMGFGELRRQLEYKVPAQGGLLVAADRFYPSRRTCRRGKRVKDTSLSEPVYVCVCGHVECRDLNAARNLLGEALRTVGRTGAQACGPFASTPRRQRFGASERDEAGSPASDVGYPNNSINLSSAC